jgi:hypothetical protein
MKTRKAITVFAENMEAVLQKNDGKGGWGISQCEDDYLQAKLMVNLAKYILEGDPKHLLDLANYSMMLWNRWWSTGNDE